MLNPCSPCVCTGAPCEQCMFGYRSLESNHEHMKELLLAYTRGEKPSGWKCAAIYTQFHSNWRDELGECEKPDFTNHDISFDYDFVPDKKENHMLKVKIISEPFSIVTLEKKVTQFINRDDVGKIHTVQFSDHAVMIIYEDPMTPEKFFDP